MVFPVVMYGCESWTIKKAGRRRIDAFELWCWRRLLRVPWTARRSNQSILKEISPDCWLEGLMLKLKLQYFAQLSKELTHWKRPWCWERLKAGEEGDNKEWDDWLASPTQRTWVWVNLRSWWWTGRPGMLQFIGSQRVRHDWATELNWTVAMKGWDQMPWSYFSEWWVLSQLFHSSLSLSSRDSLVLHFLPSEWCHLHIRGYWYFSQQSWFQLVLHLA